MSSEKNSIFAFSALLLVGLMFLVYGFEISFPGLAGFLSFQASSFFSEPWTIFTSIFIHSTSDITHLLNNMFFLAIFGTILERWIKTERFLFLFVLAGIFANTSAFLFYFNTPVLGASGAISGIILTLAVIKPRSVGLAMGVPMPMWGVAVIWFFTNAVMVFGGIPGIAAEAHLYGAFFGLLAGIYLRKSVNIDSKGFLGKKKYEEADIPEEYLEEWEKDYLED